ncbi:unnamed protein product [Ectocarpus sp. 4 AP-2014]
MTVIRATIGPGESSAWAGKSLDNWKGLEPLTVEREGVRERLLGSGTADAPLELEEEEGYLLRSPGLAGGKNGTERHRLYDLNGAMPPKERPVAAAARANGDRSKERSSPAAGKEGSRQEGGNKQASPARKAGGGGGGSVAATKAAVEEIDVLVAERMRSMRAVDVDLAAAERPTPKKPAKTWASSRPPPPPPNAAASNHEKLAAKKGGDGGADRPKDKDRDTATATAMATATTTATPTRRYRISSSSNLPPGWEIIRSKQPEKNKGYACRWYVYKYGNGSNLPNLKFKNLRDVEDFLHSDLPGAKIHRRALEKRKRQTEASVHCAEWRAKRKMLEASMLEESMGQPQEQEQQLHAKEMLTHLSGGPVDGGGGGAEKKKKKKKEKRKDKGKGKGREKEEQEEEEVTVVDPPGQVAKQGREERFREPTEAPAAVAPAAEGDHKAEEAHRPDKPAATAATVEAEEATAGDEGQESKKAKKKKKKKHESIARKLQDCLAPGRKEEGYHASNGRHDRGDAKREAKREARRAAAEASKLGSHGHSVGSKNIAARGAASSGGEAAVNGGKKRGAPGGDGSRKKHKKGQSAEGELDEAVQREMKEIVGAYSNKKARKELLAKLREQAQLEAPARRGEGTEGAGPDGCEGKASGGVDGKSGDSEEANDVTAAAATAVAAARKALGGELSGAGKPANSSAAEVNHERHRGDEGMDENEKKQHRKGKKEKRRAAEEEERRRSSPRVAELTFREDSHGGSSGSGSGSGGGKKKRKAGSLPSAGSSKRHSVGGGKRDDDNRRQSSRAASAVATAALSGRLYL